MINNYAINNNYKYLPYITIKYQPKQKTYIYLKALNQPQLTTNKKNFTAKKKQPAALQKKPNSLQKKMPISLQKESISKKKPSMQSRRIRTHLPRHTIIAPAHSPQPQPDVTLQAITATDHSNDIQNRLTKNIQLAKKQQQEENEKNFKLQTGILPTTLAFGKPLKSESKLIKDFSVGIASCEGRRNGMEDADLATEISFTVNGETYQAQLFGIFDGHGGKSASQYVKENLPHYLSQALEKNNAIQLSDEGIWNALKECFVNLDQDYNRNNDGTTATVAMILENKIWVANVGDSRTILSNGEEAIQLSEDAKPGMERYKKTIEKLGGVVNSHFSTPRVNGRLAVARAVGDKEIIGANGGCCVSPKPKITNYSLDQMQNGHLILACDGLYDVASTRQVAKAVEEMSNREETVEAMAQRLVEGAIQSGSGDNVSAMVIKLK